MIVLYTLYTYVMPLLKVQRKIKSSFSKQNHWWNETRLDYEWETNHPLHLWSFKSFNLLLYLVICALSDADLLKSPQDFTKITLYKQPLKYFFRRNTNSMLANELFFQEIAKSKQKNWKARIIVDFPLMGKKY